MEKELVYVVESHYSDFKEEQDKLAEWKNAWYELWRYQMGYQFAYNMELIDNRKSGVFVRILCKEAFADVLIRTMTAIGYRGIESSVDTIGVIPLLDVPENVYDVRIEE